jgi:hypothetical protein
MLVMGHMYIILERFEYFLALLYLVLGFGSPDLPKFEVIKRRSIIFIQFLEKWHTYGHVISGVITLSPQMKPLHPCLLLLEHILM